MNPLRGIPMGTATMPAPDRDGVPVVGSFAVTAQLRMTAAGTTARLAVVSLSEDLKLTPATLLAGAEHLLGTGYT